MLLTTHFYEKLKCEDQLANLVGVQNISEVGEWRKGREQAVRAPTGHPK